MSSHRKMIICAAQIAKRTNPNATWPKQRACKFFKQFKKTYLLFSIFESFFLFLSFFFLLCSTHWYQSKFSITLLNWYCLWIEGVTWIWLTLVLVRNSKRIYFSAMKNANRLIQQLDQFVHPMETFIVHYAKWKRKRVELASFQFHLKIVQQLLTAMLIAMQNQHHLFVDLITNSIEANAKCAKKIAASTCLSYQWSVVWLHLHSKDAPECVHRISSRYAVLTQRHTAMNAF